MFEIYNETLSIGGIENPWVYALSQATGRAGCKVHTAGGALFWFTSKAWILVQLGFCLNLLTADPDYSAYFCCFILID